MQFDEMGKMDGKTLMLLPGTACDYQTNFCCVIERLAEKYHMLHGQGIHERVPWN